VKIIQGILLFLFIPLVLYLFLTFPFDTLPSLIIGALIMFGHRFIARPYMLRNIDKRCIWNGRLLNDKNQRFVVKTKKENLTFFAFSAEDKGNALKFFNYLHYARSILKIAILGTLAWYIVSLLLGEINSAWRYLPRETFVQIFKVVIAFTVVLSSVLYRFAAKAEPVKAVFPTHNFFLLGIRWILWVFRIVGILWIVQWILSF
jgi:hypothetical protein